MASRTFYAIVAGAGAGLGRAAAVRFAKTYPVVLFARKPDSYNDIVSEIKNSGGQAYGITADVTDLSSIDTAFEQIKKELPSSKLAAAIFNVNGGFVQKPFLELNMQVLDESLAVATRGFFAFAQKTIPLLLDSVGESPHPPTLIVTGATASTRGNVNFSTLAAGKSAQRAIAQSLAREFSPKGVHVATAIIDGLIDAPRVRGMLKEDGMEDGKLKPEAIAETYWHLHAQHRSAFTHEVDLRPYAEGF